MDILKYLHTSLLSKPKLIVTLQKDESTCELRFQIVYQATSVYDLLSDVFYGNVDNEIVGVDIANSPELIWENPDRLDYIYLRGENLACDNIICRKSFSSVTSLNMGYTQILSILRQLKVYLDTEEKERLPWALQPIYDSLFIINDYVCI